MCLWKVIRIIRENERLGEREGERTKGREREGN